MNTYFSVYVPSAKKGRSKFLCHANAADERSALKRLVNMAYQSGVDRMPLRSAEMDTIKPYALYLNNQPTK